MIKVNEELRSLIPPLTNDEFDQLTKNILAEGIRDPLVVWNDTIVDGHNRYEIAQAYDLSFDTIERQFENIDEVKVWMIDNQKGRRNLPDWIKYELIQVKADILKEKGRINQGRRTDLLPNIGKKLNHNTQEEVADDLGWSKGKVAMADVVNKHADDELRDQLRRNETTINKAYQQIRKEEKKKEVEAKIQAHKEEIQLKSDLEVDIFNTDKRFNIIYADPAWSYWEGGEKNQSLHYQTMTIDQIKELPVSDISDENAILFLWVTFPILREAFEVIESWGFNYSTCGFVWVKRNKQSDSWFFGNGAWTRANSELCLIGTKGSVTRLDASISQVLDDRIMEHSKKPERVRDLITSLVGELPRIELFSRNQRNDGWFNWGNSI